LNEHENTQPGAAGIESKLRKNDDRIKKQANTIDGTSGSANAQTGAPGTSG
jgi:hypothetical protein